MTAQWGMMYMVFLPHMDQYNSFQVERLKINEILKMYKQ